MVRHRAPRRPSPLPAYAAFVIPGLLACLLGSLSALPAVAQGGVWTPQGPPGGPVSALTFHATNPQLVYAGTRGSGIFRSTAGGTDWLELSASPFRGPVNALVVDPSRPARVLAALEGGDEVGGVFRTTNRGAVWSRVLAGSFQDLALDPVDPDTVWAAAIEGVFRSTDGGVTWDRLLGDPGGGAVPVLSIAVDPSDPAIVYAGGDGEVLRTDDGGLSWTTLPLPSPAGPVHALVVDPDEPTTVFAGTEGGLLRSSDGGSTWTELGPGIFSVRDLVVNPEDPDVLHLAGALVVFDPPAVTGVFRSTDGGDTWTPVSTGLAGRPLALALDPRDPERLLAGTTDGAFLRTATGTDWVRADDGLFARPIRDLDLSPADPDRVLAVDAFEHAFRSPDGGASWEQVSDIAFSLADHPADASRVYGFSSTFEPFLVSRDGGRTLELGEFPLSTTGSRESVVFRDLAVHPTDPDTVYVSELFTRVAGFQVTELENVRRSTDGGETWDAVWGRPTLAARDLAVDPSAPSTVYAATPQGLRVTRDGGATWDAPVGFPSLLDIERVVPSLTRPGRVWLAGGSVLVRSDDSGRTGLRVDAGLPAGRVLHVTADPGAEVVYVLVEGQGVFRSSDGGSTWTDLTGSLVRTRVTGPLAISPTDPRTLHVGTVTGVRTLVDPPACTAGPHHHCLLGGRFGVRVEWRDFQGGSGSGTTRPVTDDTGAFWFFEPSNLELMVKVIDGRTVNGHFWVFYGSLSNVGFDLTVTDTFTGTTRVFENASGRFASAGITDAFPAPALSGAGVGARLGAGLETVSRGGPDNPSSGLASDLRSAGGGLFVVCGTQTNLCLQDERFRVEVTWRNFEGGAGSGRTIPLTPDTGAFWFFQPDNVELVVKVLDARTVNGHFWVFLGSLSNVGFEVVVTDTANGRTWIRRNPAGTFASFGDTFAFPDVPLPKP